MSSRIDPILSTVGGFEAVKRNWGWFLALGIVQIVLGTIALGESVLMTAVFGRHARLDSNHRRYLFDFPCLCRTTMAWLRYRSAHRLVVCCRWVHDGRNPGEAAVTLTLIISLFLMIRRRFSNG